MGDLSQRNILFTAGVDLAAQFGGLRRFGAGLPKGPVLAVWHDRS